MTKRYAAMLPKFQGCLLGAQLGDAMGMPVETMQSEQILKATGEKGVKGFLQPIQRRLCEMTRLKAGDTTDDWYFSNMNAERFIALGRYDVVEFARHYVAALEPASGCIGMGGTTRKGLREVALWFASGRRIGRDPHIPPVPRDDGRKGNGVAMQIAPFGLFFTAHCGRASLAEYDLLAAVMSHGFVTHPDPRSSIGAFAVAFAVAMLLDKPVTNAQEGNAFMARLIDEVRWAEQVQHCEESQAFSTNLAVLHRYALWKDKARFGEVIGTNGDVCQSVPFALGTFLRHPGDFRAGVLEAVNAGGDTDTNASIVGALIGANVGIGGIPVEWMAFRAEYRRSLDLANRLLIAALNPSLFT